MTRDSGRHSQSGDPSGAPAEGCQSGPAKTGHRPTSGANLTPSGVEAGAIAAEMRARGYWQREIVLRDDGGHEDTWRTREGYEVVAALPSEPPSQGDVEGRAFTTGICHACGYVNDDRGWPLRLDTGVRGALEAASRLIQQMDRDKAWISTDVSAVIGQIAETLASKEDGRP